MKALLSVRPGGPETLELSDFPDPAPGPGQVVVNVETCGVNFPDGLLIRDLYQGRFDRPFAPGGEIAGTVTSVGCGVSDLAEGDRVAAFAMIGGMAEYCVAEASNCYRIDPGDDPGKAAQIPTIYATSYHALVDRGRIAAGETVLVLGAGSGVGLAAVNIAHALGAGVLALASSEAKCRAALAAGADRALLLPDADAPEPFAAWLKRHVGPEGADLIYDPVGGPASEAALRAIAWGGRHLIVGFPGGIPKIALNLPLLKGGALIGVFMGEFARREPDRARRNVATLFDMWRDSRIDPVVTRAYPLARGADAIAAIERREVVGKYIVVP